MSIIRQTQQSCAQDIDRCILHRFNSEVLSEIVIENERRKECRPMILLFKACYNNNSNTWNKN